MITYKSDGFGLTTLFVWHGSAVFRAIIPASISTGMLVLYDYTLDERLENRATFVHPYSLAVFVVIIGFLLVFRLNYSYHRHWEAASQLHVMTSKLLDSAIVLAAFHYQAKQYDDRRPLAFGANPKVRNETRDRERLKQRMVTRDTITSVPEQDGKKKWWSGEKKQRKKSHIRWEQGKRLQPNAATGRHRSNNSSKTLKKFLPAKLRKQTSTTSNVSQKRWSASFAAGNDPDNRLLQLTGLESQTPSLFLQEAAHLYSLLSAVAMSTLRCDVEGAESPIAPYIPGAPLPPVNPDELSSDIQMQYYETNPIWGFLYYILGLQKSQLRRTLYNAARPFRVIGGISDNEARMLQQANGPSARMALCSMWLKEFISREHLHGSTGKVAPPIISRVYQFLSDGISAYNHCRKIAFVPFPFPHHQATVFFTFLSIFIFPLLFAGFVGNLAVACTLNAVTVICFLGTHEVARELSNPYYTVPNDLPLNNIQAQLNEALVCMWAGFHPDSWRADDGTNTVSSSPRRRKLSETRNELPLSESPGAIMLEPTSRNDLPSFPESPGFNTFQATRNEAPLSERPRLNSFEATRNEVPLTESPGVNTFQVPRNEVPLTESPEVNMFEVTRNEVPLTESPEVHTFEATRTDVPLTESPRVKSFEATRNEAPLSERPRLNSFEATRNEVPLTERPRVNTFEATINEAPLSERPRVNSLEATKNEVPLTQSPRVNSFESTRNEVPLSESPGADMLEEATMEV
ncbi:unnamed protein product [Cylindrotheca closterium]|uniref:Bestrophin homolog n=1 Tax=Cylindrotheca closterium TaxID=2856 RepID=A0AAD2CH04_9STRA|nr:unnamed protein product [Cylindrotheca closterium]